MGVLAKVGSSERILLHPRHRVGRAGDNDLVLTDSGVSGDHAVISWSGREWTARDLGSRNGTRLSGVALTGGGRPFLPGAVLTFGSEREQWALLDAGAPMATAHHLATGRELVATDGLLAIPPLGRGLRARGTVVVRLRRHLPRGRGWRDRGA